MIGHSSIDLEEGARLAGGSQKAAIEMLQALQQSLPGHLSEIEGVIDPLNYDKLYEQLHRLYGGLCYCGAPLLRSVVSQLKQACLAKQHEDITRSWPRLLKAAQLFDQCLLELK